MYATDDCGQVEVRGAVAVAVCAALARTIEGSEASLRGSLGRGTSDAFSGIDLRWVVPDDQFAAAVRRAAEALAAGGPIALLRVDPDLARSRRRRVLFVTYERLPLFWRLDLDVRAATVADDDHCDEDDPTVRTDAWSRPTSALMNVIASARAERRGRPDEADALLLRGFARIGSTPASVAGRPSARDLLEACVAQDERLSGLAGRVSRLLPA